MESETQADTVCDVRALSRKALLRVLEKFPEEEELLGQSSINEGSKDHGGYREPTVISSFFFKEAKADPGHC